MVTQETTHYEDFTIKTFTEKTDGFVTTYEEYDTKGQKISSVKGDFVEKWEYSRNRLRRYSNSHGDWQRFTYKANEMITLTNSGNSISKIIYHNDTKILKEYGYEMGKKRKWKQTTIQF